MNRVLAAVLALGTVAVVAAAAPVGAVGPTERPGAAAHRAADADADADSYDESKPVSRAHVGADGADQVAFETTMRVTADHITELRGRERVHITWEGARPSGGRASNPYGEGGLVQEYPVVILQCRGVDDPALPVDQQMRPETCWTSTSVQRSAVLPHRTAVWRHDRYGTDAERADRTGMDPFPVDECKVPSTAIFSAKFTPFVAADGTHYLGCDSAHMPPEAAVDSAFPPAELAAFTNEDGTGQLDFEVRSDVENQSLGCSDKVKCAIVVVPIAGISCIDEDIECRRGGSFLAGSSNFEGSEPQATVAPRFWWSPSNWRNRFTIPISFGLPPDTCELLDPRPPVGFYGSELMSQASLQWAPAYCLNEERFKFQHNAMPDATGFNLMATGGAAAALVSGPQRNETDVPIGFAPTAVTGFVVGHVVDRPGNAGEYERLRLNPRLLAKLLTQSYPASTLGRAHPGLELNPLSINLDPEFKELNPGLDEQDREAAATVLSLSNSSDVIEALTGYIASDPAAMAFIAGKPDPWGMKINPSYRGLPVPRREWPLLDDYKPVAAPGTCRYANNDTPYLSQVAAPVTTLRKVADALVDSWPNVQTTCEGPLAGGTYRLGRVDRQPFGQRFIMGIVSMGDAARFGLRAAELQTKPGTYVGPSQTGMARAIKLAEQRTENGPFVIDQADIRKDGRAYPGTMVVYTAARLTGMEDEQAQQVAEFVRIATSEGQKAGRSNGELPEGFLPIEDSGATAKLLESAEEIAALVEGQGAPSDEDDPPPTGGPAGGPADGGGSGPVPPGSPIDGPVPEPVGGNEPSVAPTPSAAPSESAESVEMPETQQVGSGLAGGLLPLLILIGAIGCVAATLFRVVASAVGRRP